MFLPRAALLVILATSVVSAAEPQWIWSHKDAATKAGKGDVLFRKAFSVDGAAETATITIAADNHFDLFLNGRSVGSGGGWNPRLKYDIKPLLLPGRNILAIRGINEGDDNPAGLAVELEIKPQGKDAIKVGSDASWKFSTTIRGTWATPEFDDSKWEAAVVLGEYGKTGPWGAPGKVIDGQTSPAAVAKAKNTERGLFEFKDGDRLVLLGSGFIERMQSNGYFELELISAHPDKNITIRNLGWSGDNVWGDARAVFGQRADGFKRLLSDVNLCNPSVILVCYGENEAYAGESGLDEFRTGFNTLLDALEKTGARLVIATPRKHENVGKPFPDPTKYNADLRKYCDVMKDVAKERELTFVDWYEDIFQNENLPDEFSKFTGNGVHLSPVGYWRLADDMAWSLGGALYYSSFDLDTNMGILEGYNMMLENVVLRPERISFTARERRLDRAGIDVVLPRASLISAEDIGDFRIRGLKSGKYLLVRDGDGEATREATAEEWAAGDVIFYDQFYLSRCRKLLAAINEKNFLFFNRYRPQNETYLFLFRKHEQGNNAVEIPQFDPLIAEQEKIIAELKKPPKQKFELKRVGE